MDQKLSYKEYMALVEKQARDIIDKLAFAATGDLDTKIDVPEGIEPLTDLAIGISYLLDDMQALLVEQQTIKDQLETAVSEKTADLSSTLADLQSAQQRYTQQAWHHYTSVNKDDAAEELDLDESWLMAMAEAVEQKETIKYGGEQTHVAVPLEYSNSLIGVLGFASDELEEWDQDDLQAVEDIAEQIGLALENQRLLDQTQQQLAELATINEIAKATSDQLSMDALLVSIGESLAKAFNCWGVSIALYNVTSKKVSFPYFRYSDQDDVVLSDIHIDEPSLTTRILKSQQPVIIHRDLIVSREKEQVRSFGNEPASYLGVPLLVGQRAVGVIALQRSDEEGLFAEADQRLLVTIARNVSVAVENARLFGETQARARQLETLSEIEVALSMAESENEVLAALLTNLPESNPHSCSLSYLHHSGEDIYLDIVGNWVNGQFWDEDGLAEVKQILISQMPMTDLWIRSTGQIVYVEDVDQSDDLPAGVSQQAEAQGWKALALLPLRTGRNVQAIFVLTWAAPHTFSELEKFVFERVMEPLGAVVTSRRARLAQQQALEEMESLYEASAQLNVAQSYDDIVDVLRTHSIFGDDPVFASLDYFLQRASVNRLPETVEVLARYEQAGMPPMLDKVYRIDRFPTVGKLIKPNQIVVVEDIENDPRVTEAYKEFFVDEVGAKSALFVPLIVGQQWIGLVNVFYPQVRKFSTQELRRPMALAAQAAVATQSLRLLKSAQQRAQREQILREVTERVRNATDIDLIMKTAVQEVSRALGRPTYIKLETKDQ